MSQPQLTGKSAVVTGSSSGIGRAIAVQLAREGADVVVHGRSRQAADETAATIRELGCRADIVLCDLADDAGCAELVDRAWSWSNGIDIWVNNAGTDVLTGDAADASFDQKLSALWQVDVQATIRLSRRVGKRMIASASADDDQPVILNMGWDQAELGMAGDSGEMFAAIKGAVMAFTKSLARSLAPHVRVNCLAPGWIRTEWGDQASDYWQRRACEESLLERWGTPNDVARVAAFLASPAAGFVTGQIIAINGGFGSIGAKR